MDIRGRHGALYVPLSVPRLTFSLRTENATFFWTHHTVVFDQCVAHEHTKQQQCRSIGSLCRVLEMERRCTFRECVIRLGRAHTANS